MFVFQCHAYAVFSFNAAFFECIFLLFNLSFLHCSCIASYVQKCNEIYLESDGVFYYYILFFLHFSAEPKHYQGETTTRANTRLHVFSCTWFSLTMAQMSRNLQ
jgi:hypothetical protein